MPSATQTHTSPTPESPSVTHVTPRRTLFGAAALMALAIPARAADHNPDADLIAACANYERLARQHDASYSGSWDETKEEEEANDAARVPIYKAMLATVERIEDMPLATTFEGVRALVRAVAVWDRDVLDQFNLSNTSLVLMAIVFESLAGDIT